MISRLVSKQPSLNKSSQLQLIIIKKHSKSKGSLQVFPFQVLTRNTALVKIQKMTCPVVLVLILFCLSLPLQIQAQTILPPPLLVILEELRAGDSYPFILPLNLTRPIMGHVRFNTAYGFTDDTEFNFRSQIYTTLHEMGHVLGFSSGLYDSYIDPDTNQLLSLTQDVYT